MKSLNPAKPWGPKDFFLGVGYHTQIKPEGLLLKTWVYCYTIKAEHTAEDQPFYLVPGSLTVLFNQCISVARQGHFVGKLQRLLAVLFL